jgi:hypothetical protein
MSDTESGNELEYVDVHADPEGVNFVPRNGFGEKDPRWASPFSNAFNVRLLDNAALAEMRDAVLRKERDMPTTDEVYAISIDQYEHLKELWEHCYLNLIDLPDQSISLTMMTPRRRAMTMKWRDFFIMAPLPTLQQRAVAMSINLCPLIIRAWKDMLALKEDDASE